MECKECKQGFEFLEADKRFLRRMKLPAPTLCSDCRRERRLAFWPYGVLQKRKCDFSGEAIISTFPADTHFPVYKREHWFSDKWNPPQMEIDWNRPFFDQLYELQSKTPHFHQLGKNNLNCDYTDDVWECKDLYLCRSMGSCEDLLYSYRILNSKDCMDLTYCYDMEQSYECTYCFKGYHLKFALECRDCSDSWFLYNCRGCRHCFMCWNLRNKEYHILNKPYTKEEYEAKIRSLHLNSRHFLTNLKRHFENHLKNDAIHKSLFVLNSQNCEGNYISNCKNCKDAYFLENSEDSFHLFRSPATKTCWDCCGLYRGEICYEVCQSTDLTACHFANYSVDCSDSQYIDQCFNSHHLFGCVGLKRKKYCILNKPYSETDYHATVKKLVEHLKKTGEYGEFFPYRFAYNGFNATLGAFYYQETEESIRKKGGFFEEATNGGHSGMDANTLSDLSEGITDDLIGKPIQCSVTGRPYSFIQQELDFYRHHKLPLPALYPEERNRLRFGKLLPLHPHKAKCFKCQKEITSYYPEEWGYKKVACEECYLKEIY